MARNTEHWLFLPLLPNHLNRRTAVYEAATEEPWQGILEFKRILQGGEEALLEEKGSFIDHSGLASGDDSGGGPIELACYRVSWNISISSHMVTDDPIALPVDDDSGVFEAEADRSSFRADEKGLT